jgi:hypothetical protein
MLVHLVDSITTKTAARFPRGAAIPHLVTTGVASNDAGRSLRSPTARISGGVGVWAEVDANPNPLREEVFPFDVEAGHVTLADRPGLGVEPDLKTLARFIVAHR